MTNRPMHEEVVPLDTHKLRALRVGRGWTYAEAAERAGMTNRQRWYAVESGQRADPSISTVERMARALGVTVDDLLVKPAE
jgi:transcriptional regulator with XRE-family HTH domain